MKKTLKKLSAFLKRVFKCGCNKIKSRRKRKIKTMKGKIMKGGWLPKKSNAGLQSQSINQPLGQSNIIIPKPNKPHVPEQ